MTTVVFVRHGETEWNRIGRWQGHADVPLSAEGREQAQRLAARFVAEGRRFDHAYASDLQRALETAQIVAAALDVAVHPLLEIREIDIGAWSGLTSDEIRERFADEWSTIHGGGDCARGKHGETMAGFRARVADVVNRLVAEHPGQQLLIVTHGGPIRAFLHYVEQRTGLVGDIRIDNTSITEVRFDAGQAKVVRANDIAHLEGMATVDVMAS